MSTKHSKAQPKKGTAMIHLLWGNQSLELEEEGLRLAHGYLSEEERRVGLFRFDLAELGAKDASKERQLAENIQQEGESLSFLSTKKAILIENLQQIPAKKSPLEKPLKELAEINLVKIMTETGERWADGDSLPAESESHNHLTAKNLIEEIHPLMRGGFYLRLRPEWQGQVILRMRAKKPVEVSVEELLTQRMKSDLNFAEPHAEDLAPSGQGRLMDLLLGWLEDLPDDLLLVLQANVRNLKELPSALAKSLEKNAKARKMTIAYDDFQATGWIIQRARAKGFEIEQMAAKLLADTAGSDFRLLDQELEKLRLQVEPGRSIDAALIWRSASQSMRYSVFRVGELLAQRDLAQSVQSIEKLLFESPNDRGSLFGLIASQFRRLVKIHWMRAQGLSPKEMATKLKMHPFLAEKMIKTALHFETKELENIVMHLAAIDVRVKFAKAEASSLMENFAFMVCTKLFMRGPMLPIAF